MRKFLLILGAWFITSSASAFETPAKNLILMDYETGQYLETKDHQAPVPPASMSKLMTTYMVFSKLKDGSLQMTDMMNVSENAWRTGGAGSGGSTMFLPINSTVSVENLLKGMIIQSGNDACITLAENLSGSEDEFAREMNKMAKKIGLKNSHFANSTGLPHPEHQMSVEDLAILSRALIKDFPEYYHFFSDKVFVFNKIRQTNRNPLLYSMSDADGLKTGHTEEAGFCLTASVKRGDRRLIAVMTGLSSNKERSMEAANIMGYGFREFDKYKVFTKGQKITTIPVAFGIKQNVDVEVSQDLSSVLRRNKLDKIKATAVYKSPIKAPVAKGDKLGVLKVQMPKQDAVEIDLVASNDVLKMGFFSKIIANLQYLIFGAK